MRLTLLLYPIAMCLVLVYLGEHYVIDVVAGWIIVGVSFAVWGRLERRARRRRAAVSRAAVERSVGHDVVPNDPVLAPT
jgi:membrane-associated phospholipid phosphatase